MKPGKKDKAPKTTPLNPFEVKIVKKKFHTIGSKLHLTEKAQGQSRTRAFQTRQNTLLVEYKQSKKRNKFLDNRFGERNGSMSLEDKMLARFQKERSKKLKKSSAFNLEEEELTHKGVSLSSLDNLDEFDASDDEGGKGFIDADTVSDAHFGGDFFSKKASSSSDVPPERKSHKEIMAEIIAKNKQLKHEKARERHEQDEQVSRLDEDLPVLRQLLAARPKHATKDEPKAQEDYDVLVRELLYEPRGTATARSKTPEEIALEEKIRLEELERERIRRMRSAPEDSDEENDDEPSLPSHQSGDSLEDHLFLKKRFQPPQEEIIVSEEEEEEEEGEEEEGEEGDEDGEEEEEGDEEEEVNVDFSHLEEDQGKAKKKIKASKGDGEVKTKNQEEKKKMGAYRSLDEVPYVLKMPPTYAAFKQLVEDQSPQSLSVIFHRLLVNNNPTIDFKNKSKTEQMVEFLVKLFFEVVDTFDNIFLTQKGQEEDEEEEKKKSYEHCLAVFDVITRSLFEVCQFSPNHVATVFREHLLRFHHLASDEVQGLGVLLTAKLVACIFPVSDKLHPTTTPTTLLLGKVISSIPIDTPYNLLFALFASQLFYHYVESSKRVAPEPLHFLRCVLASFVGSSNTEFFINFKADSSVVSSLLLDSATKKGKKKTKADKSTPEETDSPLSLSLHILLESRNCPDTPKDIKSTLKTLKETVLHSTLTLVGRFSKLYNTNPGYPALFSPLEQLVSSLCSNFEINNAHTKKLAQELASEIRTDMKKVIKTRIPLVYLEEKPLPLRTFKPRFDMSFSRDLKTDADRFHNERKRLKKQVHSEIKGAMRELRKDSDALFVQKKREEDDFRQEIEKKRNRVMHLLEDEQKGLNEYNKIKTSIQRKRKRASKF